MKINREKRIEIQKEIKESKLKIETKSLLNKILDDSKLGVKLYYEESEEMVINENGHEMSISKLNYIYFEEDKEKELNFDDGESHLLIEGDNYLALKHLKRIGQKVDVIYIDPPYNTGSEFVYNDTLVKKDDSFKHSYWLSFMKRRLELAKDLLSDNGIIFVSIDDNEQAYLKVIMDEIFGEEAFVANINWQSSFGGKNDTKLMPVNTEYILCYSYREYFNKIASQTKTFKKENDLKEKYGNYERSPLCWSSLTWYEKLDFPIYVNKSEDGKYYPTFEKGGNSIDIIYAGSSSLSNKEKGKLRKERLNGKHSKNDWCFYWSKEVIEQAFKEGFVEIYKKPNGEFDVAQLKYEKAQFSGRNKKVVLGDQNLVSLRNIISDPKMSSKTGNDEGKEIFGSEIFSYPKPSSLISKLLRVGDNDDIVLDFFAGSGTTGQSVMSLNQEDEKSNRRFIGVTLGMEASGINICNEVTYERLHRVTKGTTTNGEKNFKWINNNVPFYQNLRYLKVKMLDKFDGNLNVLNINKELYEKEFNTELTLELISDE